MATAQVERPETTQLPLSSHLCAKTLPRRIWPVAAGTSALPTLRYGIQGENASAIEALLKARKPIATTQGAMASSPPSASRDVAVIIANIDCPEFRALNQRLGRSWISNLLWRIQDIHCCEKGVLSCH